MIFFLVDKICQTISKLKRDGLRSTVYGLRSTVYGLRSTVYGLRSTVNNGRNYSIIIAIFAILIAFSACGGGGGGGGGNSETLRITTPSLPGGVVDEHYSYTLAATGPAPITWNIESGALPDGLDLNETTGEISGTPTTADTSPFVNTFTFTVKATSDIGNDTKELSIEITFIPVAPTIILYTQPPNGVKGEYYSHTFAVAGSAPITWSIESGALPDGLDLNETTGEISGMPTTTGTFTFRVKAMNRVDNDAKDLSIEITLIPRYVIENSGPSYNYTFTATKGGVTIGAPAQPIQTVIDAIKIHANGEDCEIQFNEYLALDIGADSVTFDGSGSPGWGIITLLGYITSENRSGNQGTILLQNGVSIDIKGRIANTADGDASVIAVNNNSTGTITISDYGIVEATSGYAIYNYRDGAVTISSGGVSASYIAVYNNAGGTITISGGGAYSKDNVAVFNSSIGTVNISGGGVGGASGIQNYQGTINISGGLVYATSGTAVFNTSIGTVNISGGKVDADGSSGSAGTIFARQGTAVYNASTGAVNISGGTVSATEGYAVYNDSVGKIIISGTAMVTSANTDPEQGTIYLANNGSGGGGVRLEITGGTVKNTTYYTDHTTNVMVYNAVAVYNDSTGAVTISDGTVSGWSGIAVYNNRTGAINISDGTVSSGSGIAIYNNRTGAINISGGTVENTATFGLAIYNNSTGAINISDGTVSAGGNAIYNNSIGKITVSGTAMVTSNAEEYETGGTIHHGGTIYLANNGSGGVRLEITGGTVENTASYSVAIYNDSTGAINISGGTVSGLVSNYNSTGGTINISGGTVSGGGSNYNSTGTINISDGTVSGIVYNVSTGTINISGGTVSGSVYNSDSNFTTGTISTINISGGTVSGEVYNYNTISTSATFVGTINISGGIVSGTVSNFDYSLSATFVGTINISGGTVENTENNGRAIYNGAFYSAITISNGIVKATGTGGYAVWNDSGVVTITSPPAVITGSLYGVP